MRILIVDDEQIARKVITQTLVKSGHEVINAKNGKEAWDILQNEHISIVVSDWMMPEIDGLELCRLIRSHEFPGYIYIILLTSRDSKNDLVEGMAAGADDFIGKPFNNGELNARIRAGERVLTLEKDLEQRNTELFESNRIIKDAYAVIQKDLKTAAKIQSNLIPEPDSIYNIRFNWKFLPSTYVGGDIFNYFKLDEHHVGFYLLDVSGHGVTAALLSVSLSRFLSVTSNNGILKKYISEPPFYQITPPSHVIHSLNHIFQTDYESMQYFTMIYGIIDTRDGQTVLTLAGHPSPILINKKNKSSLIGSGGFPVGMFTDVEYDENEFYLEKGDRLILFSDGITECKKMNDEQFSVNRLREIVEKSNYQSLDELLANIDQVLHKWKGDDKFDDDITMLVLEREIKV